LPDLDQAKSAVLNSLGSIDAQRGYRHAIEEFIEWYCSEPRLSFSKSVVLRYRIHLESRHLAPGTVNLRLGAVRRLAYEASDCGLLSPDLAAGIRRMKREENRRPALRRHEAVSLESSHVQQREDHWAIVDLQGKAGHTRTVPMPGWVRALLDEWLQAAIINGGKLFWRVNKNGKAWGDGLTEKAFWHVVREYARTAGIELEQIQFLLGHVSIQTTERYLGCKRAFAAPSMIASASNRKVELGHCVRIDQQDRISRTEASHPRQALLPSRPGVHGPFIGFRLGTFR
jgi:integrase